MAGREPRPAEAPIRPSLSRSVGPVSSSVSVPFSARPPIVRPVSVCRLYVREPRPPKRTEPTQLFTWTSRQSLVIASLGGVRSSRKSGIPIARWAILCGFEGDPKDARGKPRGVAGVLDGEAVSRYGGLRQG